MVLIDSTDAFELALVGSALLIVISYYDLCTKPLGKKTTISRSSSHLVPTFTYTYTHTYTPMHRRKHTRKTRNKHTYNNKHKHPCKDTYIHRYIHTHIPYTSTSPHIHTLLLSTQAVGCDVAKVSLADQHGPAMRFL